METGFIPQLAVVAVSAAAAAAIAIFQHDSGNNFVYLLVGIVVFLGVRGWTDPDPNLHPYKVLLAGLGAGCGRAPCVTSHHVGGRPEIQIALSPGQLASTPSASRKGSRRRRPSSQGTRCPRGPEAFRTPATSWGARPPSGGCWVRARMRFDPSYGELNPGSQSSSQLSGFGSSTEQQTRRRCPRSPARGHRRSR